MGKVGQDERVIEEELFSRRASLMLARLRAFISIERFKISSENSRYGHPWHRIETGVLKEFFFFFFLAEFRLYGQNYLTKKVRKTNSVKLSVLMCINAILNKTGPACSLLSW